MILLNDTNLKGKRKINIPKYFSYVKNREKNKGEVATLVVNNLKNDVIKVTEGKGNDEYIITRINSSTPAVNVINIYGEQEGRSTKEEIEQSWLRLMCDVKQIENRNEALLIMGDMNRAVGNDEWGTKGNKERVSNGGKLIRDLLKTNQYILLNNLNLVEGGPWTFIDRQDSTRKSCLDLCIISVNLLPFIAKVQVDKDRKFTPRRVIKRKKEIKSIFTDHFSIKVELKGLPRSKNKKVYQSRWNLGKPGGWDRFVRFTNEMAEKVNKVVNNSELHIDEVIKKVDKIETKIKFASFGKTKTSLKRVKSDSSRPNDDIDQKAKDEELLLKQSEHIEHEIYKIKVSGQGRAGNIFKIMNSITDPKKGGQEASAVRDPDNDELAVTPEDIKKVTLKYCVKNLTKNTPYKDVKDIVRKRKDDQIAKMNNKSDKGYEVTEKRFL